MRYLKTSLLFGALIALVCTGGVFVVGCEKDSGEVADPVAPKATETASAAKVVNSTCPIMGKSFDPATVPDNLTRTFKGQKVGFCCGGCPPAWDKLSDAEKTAKLAESGIEAAAKCPAGCECAKCAAKEAAQCTGEAGCECAKCTAVEAAHGAAEEAAKCTGEPGCKCAHCAG